MSENRQQMDRLLAELHALAPAGYTAGLRIRFGTPLYLRSTYPQAWMDRYAARGYARRDPIVFWGVGNTGVIRWSEIGLPDPFGIFAEAQAHGLVFGAVAAVGRVTARSVLGTARSDREHTAEELDEIGHLARALHETVEVPPALPPGALEALRLLGEQGGPRGMDPEAFEARLADARARLGTRTSDEALRTAREYRLL
ncbi:autoinducer binding domain-containing protein [Jannaschia sp. W003]|uniref:autoinducer binding domain-containing protein n=1 Tax=Jannaschia sp. W003 TaxID=2867012 RepID=UPI0021A47626|nr:autoinducer binding domain-containing protein [Jannaschia sp. W003]UWQ21219.1 autoinducer binding domain-containing protein [Jannaschia sp. W003]